MARPTRESAPWIFWPFAALWDFLAFILRLTGRVLGALLGLVLMVLGIAVSMTVVGAPVGVPLTILGLLLMLRSVF